MDVHSDGRRVHYHPDQGWVIDIPGSIPGSATEFIRLREDRPNVVTDVVGRRTLLRVLSPDTHPPAPEPAPPGAFQPVSVPVALTVEGLDVQRVERSSGGSRVQSAAAGIRRRVAREPRHLVHQLDNLTFAAEPKKVLAIVGPSGAGKSTLVKALLGEVGLESLPRTAGEEQALVVWPVAYNGLQLSPQTIGGVRHLLGYVPQDDILHGDLSLEQALLFTARLRLADLTQLEQAERVARTLADVGLVDHRRQQIRTLSGGERKRASVATELLTRPPLILLDEPTSGLDPAAEDDLLSLLERLAHEGNHTIVYATHSMDALDRADQVLAVVGGQLAYYGTTNGARVFFTQLRPEAPVPDSDAAVLGGRRRDVLMYHRMSDASIHWAQIFRSSNAYGNNVERAIARHATLESLPSSSTSWATPRAQFVTQLRRSAAVLWGTTGYPLLLALQAPVLLLACGVVFGRDNFAGGLDAAPRGLLVAVVFSALAIALVNSCPEIIKEFAVYNRERIAGMSIPAYLAAKFFMLGGVSAVQALILALALLGQGGPGAGLLASRFLESWLVLGCGMAATVGLGLLVSALVKTLASAQVLVSVALVLQLLLTGALVQLPGSAVPVQYLSPAFWMFKGLAASQDLLDAENCAHPQPGQDCPAAWTHTSSSLLWALAALAVLATAYVTVAGRALARPRAART